jgi:predicted PurR-regulated permease PerM
VTSGVRILLLGFVLAAAAVLAWYLRHALLLVYISAVFAVVFRPAVDRVHRARILGWQPSRGAALLLMVAAGVIALAVLLAFAIPPLINDAGDFARRAPELIDRLRERARSVPMLRNIPVHQLPGGLAARAGAIATGVGGVLADTLTVLLLIAYLVLDGPRLLRTLLRTVPLSARDRLSRTLERAAQRMRGWLAGQLLLMLILGVSSGVTFGVMRIPYFYLLAVFAGVANIIPLLGPLVTVVLAGAVAATESGRKALGVLVFYLVYQQVENAFLTPRIMKSKAQMSSAVVLLALLTGSELAGIAGALVAVPSAVLVTEIAGEYLVGDEAPSRG